MEQKTKQSVLVFTDKRAFFSNGHRRPSGDYNKDLVMGELEKISITQLRCRSDRL